MGFKYCIFFSSAKKSKFGRPVKPLEEIESDANYKLKTDEIFKPILDFLDRKENFGESFFTLICKFGRRECLNQKSRHYSPKNGQIFQRILRGEDVFMAPKLEPIDGVVLKVGCEKMSCEQSKTIVYICIYILIQ